MGMRKSWTSLLLICFGTSCGKDAIDSKGDSSLSTRDRAVTAREGPVTAKSDAARTGWYADQPGLSPVIVGGPTFGRLFSAALAWAGEQVLAHPLVHEGRD